MGIFRGLLSGLMVLATSLSATAAPPDERYIIKFSAGAEQRVREAIKTNRGNVRRALPKRQLLAATLPQGALRTLKARADVLLVEIDPKRFPQAEQTPYGIPMVQAWDPNDLTSSGLQESVSSSAKVCIMDTGYDLDHEDLPSDPELLDGNDNCGPSCGSSGNWHEDGHGHGTHVAGTIAGLRNNSKGVVGVNSSGSLPLHIVKVFDQQGNWAYGSDLIAAIDQCITANARVVNMSLGGSVPSVAEETAFSEAYQSIRDGQGSSAGMLFIAAAGNGGSNSLHYPASYDSVMSVAAINSGKSAAPFSQYNHQVEIAGPGVAVISSLPGDAYAAWDGTSMATPHVTGVAALVWGHHPLCSAAEIRAALIAGAKDLGGPGRDGSYGHGLVQAVDANSLLNTTCTLQPLDNSGYIADELSNSALGEPTEPAAPVVKDGIAADEYQYAIQVPPGAGDLRIQIYDANPGVAGGTGDADLHVLQPNTDNTHPAPDIWDCRPYINGSSETCVEDNPAPGTWRVMVRAYLDYTNVALKASFTTGGPLNDYHFPDADLPVVGSVSPSYAKLEYNDGDMQTITEVTSGGKPSRRTSLAEHQWRFSGITHGSSVTLQLVAAVSDEGEDDTFAFKISYDGGGSWTTLCLSVSGCDLRRGGALQFYEVGLVLPPDFTGTAIVRARDNNRTPRNLANNVLYVDQLNIVTANPIAGPPPPPPEDTTLTATGEKIRKGKIRVNLAWTPPATLSVYQSVNGGGWTERGEGNGTYVDNTNLKGSPVLEYRVCETTPTSEDCSNTVNVTF